jgi:hypothetical protein
MLRICLILAIIAGLGAGAVEMIYVKQKMIETMNVRDQEKADKEKAQEDARKTHKELKTTQETLKTTEDNLASTETSLKNMTSARDELDKQKITMTTKLVNLQSNFDSAEADLIKWNTLNVTPEQVVDLQDRHRKLIVAKEVVESTNQFLFRKTKELQAKIDYFLGEGHIPELPLGLKAEVLSVDPKYQFIVLNKGINDGVVARGEMLVCRNGKLLGKVTINSVYPSYSVANIMPEWKQGEIMEHDQAITASNN